MNRSLLTLVACGFLLAPAHALAVPLQVAHQGQVQDADGPVTDTLEFVFALFDAVSGGNEVWSETRDVDVVDGNYTVLLGSVTAIDSVLFVEPALWLQITVEGGDPLLPRQPVASAPYAIVAGTAVNVDGGTVNASSVSVNGTTVVDGTGSWVGGAGSVGWSAISGAPADADTLAGLGLSCADGDRAVWNDGLGQWDCGTATVTLDRLDVASATAGDVLSFDGNDAAWSDAVAAGGCALAMVSDRVSELTCGAMTARVRTPSEYIAATGYQDSIRLRADGSLTTAGAVQVPLPAGTYVGLSRGTGDNNYYCAIDAVGALTCQASQTDYGQNSPPAGTFFDVACASSGADGFCCGTLTAGPVTCWEIRNPGYAPTPTGTGFVQVAATYQGACARSGTGSVSCWDAPNTGSTGLATNTPSLSGITWLTAESPGFAAVTAFGAVTSWSNAASVNTASIPPGNYIASTHYGSVAWIRDDGTAFKKNQNGPYSQFAGDFIGAGNSLLIRADGTLDQFDATLADVRN